MSLSKSIGTSERFNSVSIEVRVRHDGQGLSAIEIEKLLQKLANAGKGRSRTRYVVAFCDDLAASAKGDLYLT